MSHVTNIVRNSQLSDSAKELFNILWEDYGDDSLSYVRSDDISIKKLKVAGWTSDKVVNTLMELTKSGWVDEAWLANNRLESAYSRYVLNSILFNKS
jgi:hypothetical protein